MFVLRAHAGNTARSIHSACDFRFQGDGALYDMGVVEEKVVFVLTMLHSSLRTLKCWLGLLPPL